MLSTNKFVLQHGFLPWLGPIFPRDGDFLLFFFFKFSGGLAVGFFGFVEPTVTAYGAFSHLFVEPSLCFGLFKELLYF